MLSKINPFEMILQNVFYWILKQNNLDCIKFLDNYIFKAGILNKRFILEEKIKVPY